MSDNPNVAAALCELRSMVLDADATGMRGRSRSLRAAIAALEAQASAPGGEVTEAEVEAAAQAISQRNQANRGVSYPIELCRADARAALTAAQAARTGKPGQQGEG